MTLLLKLKREIRELSLWFKIVLVVTGIVYVSLWFWTIHQSHIQKAQGFESILPVVPDDSQEYFLLTESLLNHHEFSLDGKIETHRSPGYPIFVAAIKAVEGSYFAVSLVQILLVFASALIIRRIGIVFSGKKAGEIAAVLLLINPVTITLSLVILTDTLFLFLFVAGFYLAITTTDRKPYLQVLIASLIFSSAVYVRSMGIFVFPIFLAPILASSVSFKKQLKLMGMMLAILVLSIVPWTLRNYARVGVMRFNSVESVNLSWMVPQFLADTNHTKESDEIAAFHAATGIPEEDWANREFYDIRYADRIDAVAKKIIAAHLFAYVKFQIVTSTGAIFPSSILFMRDMHDSVIGYNRPFQYGSIHALASGNYAEFFKEIKEVWWKFAERICWLIAYCVALLAVWKERKRILTWILIFVPAYLVFMTGAAAGARLSFQAWPFIFILFAAGLKYMYGWHTSRRKKEMARHADTETMTHSSI